MTITRRRFLRSALAAIGLPGAGALLAGGCGAPAGPEAMPPATHVLRSPFPALAAQPRPARKFAGCEVPPPAVTRIRSISKYDQRDSTKSTIDPAAEARLRLETAPVTAYTGTVSAWADAVAGDPTAVAQASCAWRWLDAWAEQNALQGPAVDEALRKWELATLSCAVLKLQRHAAATGTAAGNGATPAWLQRLGEEVRADYSRGLKRATRRSNHLYWAAWAATAAGIAADDRTLFDWGVERYGFALDQIAPDGSLPLETARASRALGYHNFALAPLIMIAEAGAANGLALYEARDNRLASLIGFTLANLADPAPLARAAGAAQDMKEAVRPSTLAWLEPWYARTRDPRAEPWLRALRPMQQKRMGGDLTLIYGIALPEAAA